MQNLEEICICDSVICTPDAEIFWYTMVNFVVSIKALH